MAIDMVKVRAKIRIGSLSVVTPYILSFNVSKTRGAVSTFSASLKVSESSINNNLSGSSIQISAGEGSPRNLIFTGMVKKATIAPCWDDPSYVLLNISGEDQLSYLRGKKYTRRCRATKSSWVNITGVTRKGLKSSKFKARKEESFSIKNAELQEDGTVIKNNIHELDVKIPAAPKINTRGANIPIQIEIMATDQSDELKDEEEDDEEDDS